MGRPIYKPSFDPDSPESKVKNGKEKIPKTKETIPTATLPKPAKTPK